MEQELNLEKELSLLEEKIKTLLDERNSLREELLQVKHLNKELRTSLENKADQINNFQNQIKISKIVDSMAVEDNAAELKYKINEYIKDIDKCIALLSE